MSGDLTQPKIIQQGNKLTTSPKMIESVSVRAVRAKLWQWKPLMLTFDPESFGFVRLRLSEMKHKNYPNEYDWPHDLGLRLPDFTDPATFALLKAMVKDAYFEPTKPYNGYVTVHLRNPNSFYCEQLSHYKSGVPTWTGLGWGASEVEAWVSALENAKPKQKEVSVTPHIVL